MVSCTCSLQISCDCSSEHVPKNPAPWIFWRSGDLSSMQLPGFDADSAGYWPQGCLWFIKLTFITYLGMGESWKGPIFPYFEDINTYFGVHQGFPWARSGTSLAKFRGFSQGKMKKLDKLAPCTVLSSAADQLTRSFFFSPRGMGRRDVQPLRRCWSTQGPRNWSPRSRSLPSAQWTGTEKRGLDLTLSGQLEKKPMNGRFPRGLLYCYSCI